MADPFPPPPPPAAPVDSIRIDPTAAQIKGPREIDIELVLLVNLNKMSEPLTLTGFHPVKELSNDALRLAAYASNPGHGLNLLHLCLGLLDPNFFKPIFGDGWPAILEKVNDIEAVGNNPIQLAVRISYNHFVRTIWSDEAGIAELEAAYNEVLRYAEHTLRDVGTLGQMAMMGRALAQIVECQNGLAGAAFNQDGRPHMAHLIELLERVVARQETANG